MALVLPLVEHPLPHITFAPLNPPRESVQRVCDSVVKKNRDLVVIIKSLVHNLLEIVDLPCEILEPSVYERHVSPETLVCAIVFLRLCPCCRICFGIIEQIIQCSTSRNGCTRSTILLEYCFKLCLAKTGCGFWIEQPTKAFHGRSGAARHFPRNFASTN